MKQKDLIKQLSDREIILNVYFTQFLLIFVAFVLGIFLFDDLQTFYRLFRIDVYEIVVYGIGSAIIVLLCDWVFTVLLPKKYYDDGGINKRIFSVLPYWHIGVMTLLIALCEEILFRGVLQTAFGIVPASLLFAVVHIRYLKKVALFSATVLVSFFLGWLFLMTGNLLVSIFAHFFIDVVLGCIIRYRAVRGDRWNG